ncbi:hypothetical protein OG304_04565 [Streptomyces sp. NBC_00160]|uniref:hypothetical protein n=1 Tax=Streptomyces sp. NBC_00160 TaxID=2903628 RepID=UPI00224CE1E8|nr:hypothetical protein [Streptomyces sp. NBC_00160]MCX5302725.1 hypothetical protein [Streptomyces sp. NBC_00160]
MSERGSELMMRASRQLSEMKEFFGTLSEEDLRRPCAGGDAGDTVGAVAAHAAEGYHRLGQLLSQDGRGHGRPDADRRDLRPGAGLGDSGLSGLVARLAGSEAPISLLAGLTDQQLDGAAPPVPHVSIGHGTLEGLIEDVITHQAAHLDTLRQATSPGT